ncbi:sodium:calcium antiporter [Bacteroidota bacterium]
MVYRDGIFLLAGTIILTFMLWDLSMTQIDGIILLSLLVAYLGFLFWKKEPLETIKDIKKIRWYDFLLFPLGLVMILGSSHFLVESSVNIARIMGISEWVIGTTIVAFGTSAPELATSITAALRGRYGLSVGNLIGSDIFNMFGVLGFTAILQKLTVEIGVRSNLIVLVAMVILVLIFMRTGWRLSRREGIILVVIGLARWFYSFMGN